MNRFIEDLEIGSEKITVKELVIDPDADYPIHCDFRSSGTDQKLPLIIIAHGFLGYKRWGFIPFLSDTLAASGFHVLSFSFSMNGVDEETGRITDPGAFSQNTVSRELRDLQRVKDAVKDSTLSVNINPEGIGLMGHSRGGAVALLLASESDTVDSLVTWSTPANLDRYTERRKKIWKRDGSLKFHSDRSDVPLNLNYSYYQDISRNRKKYNIRKQASKLKIPHLMVHGDRDAAVSLKETKKLLENPKSRKRKLKVIPGCGHTFGITHPMEKASSALNKAVTITTRWFVKTLTDNQENEP
jgi:dienelactone hydrolase